MQLHVFSMFSLSICYKVDMLCCPYRVNQFSIPTTISHEMTVLLEYIHNQAILLVDSISF